MTMTMDGIEESIALADDPLCVLGGSLGGRGPHCETVGRTGNGRLRPQLVPPHSGKSGETGGALALSIARHCIGPNDVLTLALIPPTVARSIRLFFTEKAK